jgi:hypothetical protein
MALTIIIFASGTSLGQSLEIKGFVLDKSNGPLTGVRVKVYRAGRLVSETRSDKQGVYSLAFESGDTLNLLRYDLTGWNPGKVESISGARSHLINKVLLKPEEVTTSAQRQELVSTISVLRSIDSANGISEADFNKEYAGSLLALYTSGQEDPKDFDTVLKLGDRAALFRDYGVDRYSDWQGVSQSLLKVEHPQVERIPRGSLTVAFDAITNTSGWKVWSIPAREGTKLHIWALGERIRPSSSKEPGKYSLREVYDNVSDITQVVLHTSGGDYTIEVPTKKIDIPSKN